MIIFNLITLKFMVNNDTINLITKTITLNQNIKLIHITINHYLEETYNSSISKKNQKIMHDWNTFIDYWNTNILEYTKVFNIEFDKLIRDVDYSLGPLYITNDNLFIGIFILNTKLIHTIKEKEKNQTINIKSYSYLSRIEPYLLSQNKLNKFNKLKNLNSNYYNFFYGILINSYSNNNKEVILDTKLDKKIIIPVKTLLQNSMNYLPKLEINSIKKISQNPLNP